MLQTFEKTQVYKSAHDALLQLQADGADSEKLRAIAQYLIASSQAEVPPRWFAWTGAGTPQDTAVVQAMNDRLNSMIRGEDDDDEHE